MLTDPPVPQDGSCIVCGRRRGRDGLKALYALALETDPFCSTECARLWHGVSLPLKLSPGQRAYVSSLPPAA